MKRFLLTIVFLFVASASYAQAATATWNQSETPAVAQAFNYTIKIDSGTPVILQPNCTLVNAITTCTATFTADLKVTHTYTLTASNSFGSTSVSLSGANPQTSTFKISG